MKKFYYSDGVSIHGPFTLQELQNFNIRQDTMIWFEGMTDWQSAGSIPELSTLFTPVPPPPQAAPAHASPPPNMPRQAFQPPQSQQQSGAYQQGNTGMPAQPKKWLVESILVTIFCCLPFGIIGIVNALRVENRYQLGDYNGAMEASKNAGKWVKIAIATGLFFVLVYVILILAGVGFGFADFYY